MTTPSRDDEQGALFVGRQPILDRSLDTIGYELLFRDGAAAGSAEFVDGDVATARVLMNAITEIGLDTLVGQRRAFVNLTASFVAQPELLASVPADRVVLESSSTSNRPQAVRDGLARLVRAGFLDRTRRFRLQPTISSRCSTSPGSSSTTSASPTARRCNDGSGSTMPPVGSSSSNGSRTGTTTVKRKLAGADYFQGFFFARPSIVATRAVPANKITLLQLLARVNDPDSTLDDIVEILATDVAMSVKALRFVNSAAAGLTTKVESIQHASVLLGRDTLRSWTSLTLMSALDDKPPELVTLALSRAKFCELVARHHNAPDPAAYYAAGMLSLLDVMFDTKMSVIVDQLPVNDTIRAALLGNDGPITDVLRLAIELEYPDPATSRPEPHIARRPLPSHQLDDPPAQHRGQRMNDRARSLVATVVGYIIVALVVLILFRFVVGTIFWLVRALFIVVVLVALVAIYLRLKSPD